MFANNKYNRDLQKAYTYFEVDGNSTLVPIAFDRNHRVAYLHTPSKAGNVDVLKCDLRDFLINPVSYIPGFTAITLKEAPQFPMIPMSTQAPCGIFSKLQEETSQFLLNTSTELMQLSATKFPLQ